MASYFFEVFKMINKNRDKVKTLTLAALLTAMTTVATLLIQIPTPTKGYVNLGDTIVNLSAWILGPVYGAAAAGIGSAIADIISGYVIYAPVTLVAKAAMAVVSFYVLRATTKSSGSLVSKIAAASAAEVVMIAGYALFEAALYHSFATAFLGVPANAVQGALGAAVSVAVYELVIKRVPRFDKK